MLVVAIVFLVLLSGNLLSGSLNVNTLITDALTLLLLSVLLGSLLLTFLTALFLRFLLRTGALVNGVKVNLTQYIYFGGSLLLTLQCEHLGSCRLYRSFFYRCCGLCLYLNGYLFDSLLRLCLRLGFLLLYHGLGLRCHFDFRLRLRFRLFLFNHRFHFSLRAHGSSLRLFFHGFLCRLGGLGRFLTERAEVNLAQRLILLGFGFRLRRSLFHLLWLRRFLLLLRMLLEQFLRLGAYLLVLLELLAKRIILLVVQFEAQVGSHLTQVTLFLQELHCRLKSYVQFTNCFI